MINETEQFYIPQHHLLTDDAMRLVTDCMKKVEFPKGTMIIKNDRLEIDAYIIQKGIARAFVDTVDGEITFWFAREGDIVNSSAGYFSMEKGFENVQLLEDCILLRIDMQKMHGLFHTNLEICNWARTITEVNAITSEKHHLDYVLLTPEERYVKLLKTDTELLRRVPLKDIATYLGISAVSLSRIRARIKF